ncbi:hypothetical protein AB1287_12645 [Enterobacter asburiae]|uniref:hypothetical protein n=1 Tax=Scandinavium sp. UTDF21-P1B TaxID=3446379 RepID=UPI00346AA574
MTIPLSVNAPVGQSELLERLLHPTPLIKDFHYWLDSQSGKRVICSVELDALCTKINTLEATGLELVLSLRLLQEIIRMDLLEITPVMLSITDEWLAYPDLPELLDRIINFKQLTNPILLHIIPEQKASLGRHLKTNIKNLKSRGCSIVIDGCSLDRTDNHIIRGCDGIMYEMDELIAKPENQEQLQIYRNGGKFIQIAGVKPEILPLARQLAGDDFYYSYQ